jgi:hypothetical protein
MGNTGPNSDRFRALELLCNEQAKLATNDVTRGALRAMADEYRKQAERLERQQPPARG